MRHRWGIYTCSTAAHPSTGKIRASNELRPVRVVAVKLFATINGLIGDVSVNLRFRNQHGIPSPAVFLFPLSHNASLNQCYGTITSRADLSKRSVVLECHQSADREGNTKVGFVIEQSASDIVQLQLGFISPGDEIEINLQYSVLLDINEDRMVKFLFPTFLPHKLQSNYTELCTPEIYHSIDLQCRAVISGAYRIQKVLSEQRLRVNYKDEQRKHVQVDTVGPYSPVKDFSFSLVYSGLDKPHLHLHNPVSESHERTHWILSSYCAHLTMHHDSKKAPTVNLRNEYILCLDRSGSMYGDKIAHMREAVSYFIRFLQPGSFFNIISYGSTVEPLFKTSQKLTAYTSMKAIKLRRRIRADMFGTNILSLLKFIYSQSNKSHNPKQVYLITDGAVDNPEECIELVRQNSDNTRLFTFGLDSTASRYLLSNMARVGNGRFHQLKSCSNLCHKVLEAMRYASQSNLTNLKVSVFVPEGLHLSAQPDVLPQVLFSEETLSICLIISGKPHERHKTQCRVVLSGKVDNSNVSYTKEFDLREALVTHGSPLHQLAIKTHLHTLHRDLSSCRNSDEVVEISEEIVDLSTMSNLVSSHTKHISIDSQSRQILHNMPLIICRPEDNKTPLSSVVRVKFEHGIDIFRSKQVMLKSLVSLYSSRKSKRSSIGHRRTQLPVIKELPYKVPQHIRSLKENMRASSEGDVLDGHRSSVDRILSEVGGVRLAYVDTDSLQSSILNTELDSMSYGQYETDSPPTELFNIIEEYPDKGKGSGEEISSREERRRPTDLLDLINTEGVHVKCGEASPNKLMSTSDYYSLEVSPVSDALSTTTASRATNSGKGRIYYAKHAKSYSRQSSTSSGVESNSTRRYFAGSSDSSIKQSSVTTASTTDLEPKYTSLWSQFREQEILVSAGDVFDDACSETPTEELLLCDPLMREAELPALASVMMSSSSCLSTPTSGTIHLHQCEIHRSLSEHTISTDQQHDDLTLGSKRILWPQVDGNRMPNDRVRQNYYEPLSVSTNFTSAPNRQFLNPRISQHPDVQLKYGNFPEDKDTARYSLEAATITPDYVKELKMIDEDTSSEDLSVIVREYRDSARRCSLAESSEIQVLPPLTSTTTCLPISPSNGLGERIRKRFTRLRKILWK